MKLIIRFLPLFILLSAGCAGTGNLSDQSQESGEAPADFKATGNEPSWSLEIELGKEIIFSSLTEEYQSLTTAIPESERLETGTIHVTRYTSEITDGAMEINILRQECTDNMSGDKFPFLVMVEITDSTNHETSSFKGCGKYSGSFQINDIWKLDMINGLKIDLPENRQPPTLQIDIEGKSVSGYGGCNQYQGSAELVNDRLVTGNIRSTKMACPDIQDVENVFLRTISGKVLSFASSGSTLVIKDLQNELKFIRKR